MGTKKKPARAASPAGKKGPAKAKKSSQPAKAKSKTTSKATRPAMKAAAAPLQRPRVMIVPPSEPLFRATELDGIEQPKKAAPKATPVRLARPPAKLPIPQSTYFF